MLKMFHYHEGEYMDGGADNLPTPTLHNPCTAELSAASFTPIHPKHRIAVYVSVEKWKYIQHITKVTLKAKVTAPSLMFIPCISDVLEEKPTICIDCTFLYLLLRVGSYMFRQ
jgi:hypothetical protein